MCFVTLIYYGLRYRYLLVNRHASYWIQKLDLNYSFDYGSKDFTEFLSFELFLTIFKYFTRLTLPYLQQQHLTLIDHGTLKKLWNSNNNNRINNNESWYSIKYNKKIISILMEHIRIIIIYHHIIQGLIYRFWWLFFVWLFKIQGLTSYQINNFGRKTKDQNME